MLVCDLIVLMILECVVVRLLDIGRVMGIDEGIIIVFGMVVVELIIVGGRFKMVLVLCFEDVVMRGMVFIILMGDMDVFGWRVIFIIVVILCWEYFVWGWKICEEVFIVCKVCWVKG